jgi:hypothetical protein
MTVRCANGHDNPDGQSFCGECGSTLQQAVVKCANGHENAPGQRYCGECGAPLTQPSTAGVPEGSPIPTDESPAGSLPVRSDTEPTGTRRSRRLSWPRTHWKLTLLSVWLLVAAAVALLTVMPYRARVSLPIGVDSPARRTSLEIPEPLCGTGANCPPSAPMIHTTETLSFSVPCGSPILERFTDASPGDAAGNARDALRRMGVTTSGPKYLSDETRDIKRIESALETACQGPATPRLALAGGVLLAAIIGTWLFFNLTSDRRPTRA